MERGTGVGKYEYECPVHGRIRSDNRGDSIMCSTVPEGGHWPDDACIQPARRIWGVNVKPSFHEGYNPTLGQYVSSRSQLNSALSRASDEASRPRYNVDNEGNVHEVIPAPVNYKPVDMRDKAALGVTNEGLDSTYDSLRRQGKDDQARRLKALMDD